jgi:hypothetical protein
MRHLIAVGVAALLYIPTAHAQAPACVKRDDLVKHLAAKYQEQPRFHGLGDNGGLLEIFVAHAGATWTAIISMPNGVSCMIATGRNWDVTIPEPLGESL